MLMTPSGGAVGEIYRAALGPLLKSAASFSRGVRGDDLCGGGQALLARGEDRGRHGRGPSKTREMLAVRGPRPRYRDNNYEVLALLGRGGLGEVTGGRYSPQRRAP